eukprot:SAG11_NODE_11308_length_769_cov_1.517910_1_plen_130_part_01
MPEGQNIHHPDGRAETFEMEERQPSNEGGSVSQLPLSAAKLAALGKAADKVQIDFDVAGQRASEIADVAAEQGKIIARAIVRSAIILVLAPFCIVFMSTVFVDIIVNTRHVLFSLPFLVMVLAPAASFLA